MADDRRVKRHVDVYDTAGVAHSFGPEDEIPPWARSKITRSDLWADNTDGVESETDTVEDTEDATSEVEPDDGDVHTIDDPDEPPRAGRGSGIEAWKAYAEDIGVDVDDDMSRDDIIEAVDSP